VRHALDRGIDRAHGCFEVGAGRKQILILVRFRLQPAGDKQRKKTAAYGVSDQVIRENPASRGTETSAEVLVGPPWRMESNAGQQRSQWY
jgi:hypothetical protein